VVTLLAEAASDGRLTLEEHSERTERAYAARTLGELAALTGDLTAQSGQPIRLDGRRPVAGVFSRELREGRWVVPEHLAVAAVFGEVTLDLRDALLQARRTTVLATVLGGTVQLIVPDGVAVETTGKAILTRTSGAGGGIPAPETPVIEIRAFGLAGRVKVVRPRRSRWRGVLNRRRS
jgi:hypothetical protein